MNFFDVKISVIVPIYNVELYLVQCINSLLNQSYKNIEVILVDDGATDECPQICDEYADKDNRVKVIHKKNGGLSSARNAGMDICEGDFICFIDSDDWIENEMLECLLKIAIEKNADIVSCGTNYVYPERTEIMCPNSGQIVEIPKERVYATLFDTSLPIRSEVWNKLYSRNTIKDIRFKVGQIFEDVYFERMALLNTNVFVSCDKPLYNYRINRKGSTNFFFDERKFSIFTEVEDFANEMLANNYQEAYRAYMEYLLVVSIRFYSIVCGKSEYIEMKQNLRLRYKKYFYQYKETGDVSIKYYLFLLLPSLYLMLSKIHNK